MIRDAEKKDLPTLVDMAMRFADDSDYSGKVEKNPAALMAMFEQMIEQDQSLVRVLGEDPIGVIAVYVYEHPMSLTRVAFEIIFWVQPESRGMGLSLVKDSEKWARSRGARKMQLISPNDRVSAVYRRMGYEKLEEHYQKEL